MPSSRRSSTNAATPVLSASKIVNVCVSCGGKGNSRYKNVSPFQRNSTGSQISSKAA